MKMVSKLLILALFTVYITLFFGCKKNAEIPTLYTAAVSMITTTSAETGGTVNSNGGTEVTVRGVCWSTAAGPTVADNKTTDGTGSGTFSSSITGLTANTTYYVRAYAITSVGTAYGNEISFISSQFDIVTATLTTTVVTEISDAGAASGGNITYDGGGAVTKRGICWGTSEHPTTADSKTIDGYGTGIFVSNMPGLNSNTTYFVRAYAINIAGTAYGNQLSFTTSHGIGLRIADFPGGSRYSASGFSIGNKLYIGLGYNDGDIPVRDFWEWDQTTNVWTRKADYPGNSTRGAVGFSIGTKGYIGTGLNIIPPLATNEFWEYDTATDTWTKKANFAGMSRTDAIGFSIGNKGYIGPGLSSYDGNGGFISQDFWEWDQATNVWTEKAAFAGDPRSAAVGFSIGTKGYIGLGYDGYGGNKSDFWEWDQETDKWTEKAAFAGGPRSGAVGFSIGNKGYIGTGIGEGPNYASYRDFWEWDQSTNVWTQKVNFGGTSRYAAVAFSIGNKGYIGIGKDRTNYPIDFWEYDPALK